VSQVKDEPQTTFNDRVVDDPEFVKLIEEYLETKPPKDRNKRFNKAKKALAARIEAMDELGDGQIIRCGNYTIKLKARAGGGFEVPTWEKMTVGRIASS
jgi:hypothetical protein